jgi:hypothetical protein
VTKEEGGKEKITEKKKEFGKSGEFILYSEDFKKMEKYNVNIKISSILLENEKDKMEITFKEINSIIITEFENKMIQISTENNIYFLKNENENEVLEWMEYLTKSINNLVTPIIN